MKIILSFLFSVPILFTLSAQEFTNQKMFTGSILIDNYVQTESYSINNSEENIGLGAGFPSNFLRDGNKMRFQLSLGLKKFNTKGNYIAVNAFAGLERWEWRKIVKIENEELGELSIPIKVGRVDQNTFGLNATKSFCVTKQDSRLRAYLGVRAEGVFVRGLYRSELEDVSEVERQKIDLQLAFVPEAIYFFPGDRFSMSMAIHFLPIGVELNRQEYSDPNLTNEQSVSSFQNFDFLNHGKSRFEVGFGWLL